MPVPSLRARWLPACRPASGARTSSPGRPASETWPRMPSTVRATGRSRSGGLGQDALRVPDAGVEAGAGAFRAAGGQGLGARQDAGVVVGVHDAALRRDALDHLVGVVRGGRSGADVERLADTGLPGQEAHGPCQEAHGPDRNRRRTRATAARSGNVDEMTSPARLSTGWVSLPPGWLLPHTGGVRPVRPQPRPGLFTRLRHGHSVTCGRAVFRPIAASGEGVRAGKDHRPVRAAGRVRGPERIRRRASRHTLAAGFPPVGTVSLGFVRPGSGPWESPL